MGISEITVVESFKKCHAVAIQITSFTINLYIILMEKQFISAAAFNFEIKVQFKYQQSSWNDLEEEETALYKSNKKMLSQDLIRT